MNKKGQVNHQRVIRIGIVLFAITIMASQWIFKVVLDPMKVLMIVAVVLFIAYYTGKPREKKEDDNDKSDNISN